MAHAASGERIKDNFGDLHPPLNALQAMVESARCLYCFDAPCINACPTGIDIPGFIRRIAGGNTRGAAQLILAENILGGTCARACPTEVLCEEACVRNKGEGAPVRIGLLQRFALDDLMADADAPHPFTRAAPSGRRIAVVGAGPAGLSCAHRAALLGHEATIFEAAEKPGGLNEYGLAAYKMTGDFAQREVRFLLGVGGVRIVHGRRLGADLSLTALLGEFDAVFVGVGLGGVNRPQIEGLDKAGVRDAVDFIAELRQTADKSRLDPGRSVVVIGGGNTAVDAALQSRRLGAAQVTLVYRRGGDEMGATAMEQDLARTGDVTIRHWAAPRAVLGEGAVTAVRFERTRMQDGRLVGTGAHFEIPADRVLLAVGQKLDGAGLEGLRLEGGKIAVDASGETSIKRVFAGGDCALGGQDLTVQAVEDGKRAALAIDRMLRGGDVVKGD